MLDHVGLDVSDIKKAKDFYAAALKPLGYEIFMEWEKWLWFAVNGKPDFWLNGLEQKPRRSFMWRFVHKIGALVDQFYAAAIAAGGFKIMVRQGFAKFIILIIMAHLFWIQMVIILKRFAMRLSNTMISII